MSKLAYNGKNSSQKKSQPKTFANPSNLSPFDSNNDSKSNEHIVLRNKISMLQSNLNRVYNQNQKLLPLLECDKQIDQMLDFIDTTDHNKSRFQQLQQKNKQVKSKIKSDKLKSNASIIEIYEKSNKIMIGVLHDIMEEGKGIIKYFQDQKRKMNINIQKKMNQFKFQMVRSFREEKQKHIHYIQSLKQQFHRFYEQNIAKLIQNMHQEIKEEMEQCRKEIGQLYNEIDYYVHEQYLSSQSSNKENAFKYQFWKQNMDRFDYTISILQSQCRKLQISNEEIEQLIHKKNVKYLVSNHKVQNSRVEPNANQQNLNKAKLLYAQTVDAHQIIKLKIMEINKEMDALTNQTRVSQYIDDILGIQIVIHQEIEEEQYEKRNFAELKARFKKLLQTQDVIQAALSKYESFLYSNKN